MNVNVRKSDCRFYVDEAHRKVVCVIPCTRNMVINYIGDSPFRFCMTLRERDALKLPNSFTGIATCNENDTFDEEIGKLIAYDKAKMKLNTSFFKRANKFVNKCDKELYKLIDSLNDFGSRLSEGADRREAKIEEYFNANRT